MNILIHLLKLSIFSIPALFLSHVSSREHQQLGMCNKIYQSRSKNAIISVLPLRLLTSSCSTESLTRRWTILSFPQVNANCAADKTQIHISNRIYHSWATSESADTRKLVCKCKYHIFNSYDCQYYERGSLHLINLLSSKTFAPRSKVQSSLKLTAQQQSDRLWITSGISFLFNLQT